MAELLDERLCDLVRNYKHLYDFAQAHGQTDKQELNVSWTVVKEKWRSVRNQFVGATKSVNKRSRDAPAFAFFLRCTSL